jgi:hypothetical protein
MALPILLELRSLKVQRPFLYPPQLPRIVKFADPIPPTQERNMQEFQLEIEKLFHKNQLFPRIKAEFVNCKEFDFEAHMREHEIDIDFGFDLLVQLVLHKRANLATLVGCLRNHFKGDCQKTTDELHKAADCDLVDWAPLTRQFILLFGISDDVQLEIDRYQYPLPMVVPPLPLEDNNDTGYYTSRGSIILRNNHHDNDVCLDHLNRVNQTKFKINRQVADTIKNRWRNLDKPKPDEEAGEYQKRVKAFEKYDRTAHDVMDHLGIANGGEFYLTHKVDKRGRTYCQGYVVNYQGTAWNKAVIEFANQEVAS